MTERRTPIGHPSIEPGEISTLYETGQFDGEFYADGYPDVSRSGLDPAAHYLWLGARLGRLGRAPQSFPGKRESGVADVLFVDGTNGTSSTPYRIERVAEGLQQLGATVRCIRGDELDARAADQFHARYVTFFRATYWEPYRTFARAMRAKSARIVFDVDDLVFDEEEVPFVDGYRCLTDDEKIGYMRGVGAYRDFILNADFCTAPTQYLANRLKDLGKKAFRIRNSLDNSAIERFRVIGSPRRDDGRFVVGYYSGSRTHQADFRNAASALIGLMEEFPSVTLRLVGDFDLSEYPLLLCRNTGDNARVVKKGLMPHSQMLEDQLECDVVLAPLEVGNPFCESKSELKFFEAALARRPVIASPTNTFRSATNNGEFAQLADTPEQWFHALRKAFSERDKMNAMAARAYNHVISNYTPEAAAKDAIMAYNN